MEPTAAVKVLSNADTLTLITGSVPFPISYTQLCPPAHFHRQGMLVFSTNDCVVDPRGVLKYLAWIRALMPLRYLCKIIEQTVNVFILTHLWFDHPYQMVSFVESRLSGSCHNPEEQFEAVRFLRIGWSWLPGMFTFPQYSRDCIVSSWRCWPDSAKDMPTVYAMFPNPSTRTLSTLHSHVSFP
jgi:hypothetical protein